MILNNIENCYVGNNAAEKIYLGNNQLWPSFPAFLERVEYLESNGNQWITTPMILKDIYSYEVEAQFSNYSLFGMAKRDDLCFEATGGYYRVYQNQYVYSDTDSFSGIKGKFSCDKATNNIKVETGMATNTYNFSIMPHNSIYPFSLFATWSSYYNSLWEKGTGRIYGAHFKSTINGTTTQEANYIPARRRADNVGGFWDSVSRTFLPNEGTQPFIFPT